MGQLGDLLTYETLHDDSVDMFIIEGITFLVNCGQWKMGEKIQGVFSINFLSGLIRWDVDGHFEEFSFTMDITE